ncbi:MAG TPA: hypothetical protein VGL62_01210 [Vicinamibacterales bacterium]|jgi:type II secretory pathway pseudopilin PulG
MSVHKAASIDAEDGFTLIDLLFTCSLIALLCTLAVPGLMRARGVAQSASAVGTLRVINSAQLSFAVTCGSGFYSPDLATLGVLPPSAVQAFLPPDLSSGASFVKQGYSFTMTGTSFTGAPASCNGLGTDLAAPGYVATADPLDAVGNPNFFGTNADGTIYENAATMNGLLPESGPPSEGTPIH